METAIILGAGFSSVAGLPLTRNLFNCGDVLPRAQSECATKNHTQVTAAFKKWINDRADTNAEIWLKELFDQQKKPVFGLSGGVTWDKAIRFALSRLINLPYGSNSHYYFGICTYQSHPIHTAFWQRVEQKLKPHVIVSLNYDILVEQALHMKTTDGRTAPRCYYGGFTHIQAVRKMTNIIKKEFDLIQLGNEFVLYKLHGSVNWAWEHHSPTLKIHDDVRAVFRCDDKVGAPAIIPPIPEKEMPAEFSQIWREAGQSLLKCPRWLICGYSLPPYDIALREFFYSILAQGNQDEIMISSPDSETLLGRWKEIAPSKTRIRALPGLPEALTVKW